MPKKSYKFVKKKGVKSFLSPSSKPPSFRQKERKKFVKNLAARVEAWADRESIELEERDDKDSKLVMFSADGGRLKIKAKASSKQVGVKFIFSESEKQRVLEFKAYAQNFAEKNNLKLKEFNH